MVGARFFGGPSSSGRYCCPSAPSLAVLLLCARCSSTAATEAMLLVRSQDTARDNARLSRLTSSVAEAGWLAGSVMGMVAAERESGHQGLWTYKPWIFWLEQQLRKARRRVAGGQRWLVFLEPATEVNATALSALLAGYDAREKVYLGRLLRDETASIVHHYNTETPYPHASAGFALSGGLARRLVEELKKKPLGGSQQIEPVWELAKWIKDTCNITLEDRSDAFCAAQKQGCATWISQSVRRSTHLKPREDVVIGVKTVAKFHASRIPLINEFWGSKSSAEVLYLSNEAFDGVAGARVVDLSPEFGDLVDPAKESTKQGSGHCSKMEAIIKYLFRHRPGKKWYVVTDDDTLLNVPRLLEVLDSHDSSEPIYLGERYGWAHMEEASGTNYITTGGGMALSAPALTKLAQCSECTCRSADAPDDMTLGTWFKRLQVPIVHEEGFHQSEPHNYHPELLAHAEPPVSFHRFAVRLPRSTPEEQLAKARRDNWQDWVRQHFGRLQGSQRGDGGHEL